MTEADRPRDAGAAESLLLTPEEVATLLRVGRTTVYALMKAGDLRPVHIGRSCRPARAELERYVHILQNAVVRPVLNTVRRPIGRKAESGRTAAGT